MKIAILLFFVYSFNFQAIADRSSFFKALSGNTIEPINIEIQKLEKKTSTPTINAYLGGLYMKKASFLTQPKEKLETFRKGQQMLETEIKIQPNNIEMRFIRLILQENSPKMLKYSMNLEEDKALIKKNYINLDTELKTIIFDYSKTSNILKPQDFK